MRSSIVSCDLCLGTDLVPYGPPGPPERDLVGCRQCGLVAATAPRADTAEEIPLRDPHVDARRAVAVMRLLRSGRVLEIGCGQGHLLAGLDPDRYEAVGLELVPEVAAQAAQRLRGAGVRGSVLEGRLQDVKLPPESFDLVALVGVLERASSPRAVLMEISRLLRDTGYAFIETPSLSSWTARILGSRWHPLHDPTMEYFFTPVTLERLTSACGLAAGRVRSAVPVGWPSPGTLVYIARKSAVSLRRRGLAKLVEDAGTIRPVGATGS